MPLDWVSFFGRLPRPFAWENEMNAEGVVQGQESAFPKEEYEKRQAHARAGL